jgi:hypothetical protein
MRQMRADAIIGTRCRKSAWSSRRPAVEADALELAQLRGRAQHQQAHGARGIPRSRPTAAPFAHVPSCPTTPRSRISGLLRQIDQQTPAELDLHARRAGALRRGLRQ